MCCAVADRMKGKFLFVLVTAAGVLFEVGPAMAQGYRQFGADYSAVAAVGKDQAQVVYYRSGEGSDAAVANIYLDREFITALKPRGYIAFCMAPGRHMLGSYLDDAPAYSGKSDELYAASFKGGATYYLKVREGGGNQPLPVTKAVASAELGGQREQVHLLSRASMAEPCRHYGYLDVPASVMHEYVLPADSSFDGRDGLSAVGDSQIQSWIESLQHESAQITRVEIEGHTDPTGTAAGNQLLGQRWADIVRNAVVSRGIPQSMTHSSSAGGRAMVKHGCYGSVEQQKACYAPNRRVVLRVEVRRATAP